MLSLNWRNYRFLPVDGYGRFGLSFVAALHRLGVKVHPCTAQQLEWPGWMQQLSGFDASRLTIALMPSYELKASAGRVWNFTMWEALSIERERWIPPLNDHAERLLVPHPFLVDVFKEAGAKIPIHVIPGGTDPQEFPVALTSPYQLGQPYTFLASGDRDTRKGPGVAWAAFWMAFGDNPDVRLLIKQRPGFKRVFNLSRTDRRVSVWIEDLPSMNTVYQFADCMVFPTHGEGFGMPPREFAMTGKPVICTRFSGCDDQLDEWALPINKYLLQPSDLPGHGLWANPDVEETATQMKWCYEHREEAWAKGQQSAVWLRQNQTWDHAAKKLITLINEVY